MRMDKITIGRKGKSTTRSIMTISLTGNGYIIPGVFGFSCF
jgi:hypothetical protein